MSTISNIAVTRTILRMDRISQSAFNEIEAIASALEAFTPSLGGSDAKAFAKLVERLHYRAAVAGGDINSAAEAVGAHWVAPERRAAQQPHLPQLA